MGYHVAILRSVGNKQSPITFEEASLAASEVGGWQVSSEDEELSRVLDDQSHLTLWFDEGQLWSKNPTDAGIAAMLVLAHQLSARVRGDEFETYKTVNESFLHPDDKHAKATAQSDGAELVRKSRRNSFIFHACVIACFVGLALLVKRCEHQAKPKSSGLVSTSITCQQVETYHVKAYQAQNGLTGCSS